MPGSQLFFHISPDQCGAEDLAALFEANGLPAVCHKKGWHAEELLWAEAKNEQPFAEWPEAQLFAGLYRCHIAWRPPLEAWRRFELIDRLFPGSYFILTTRSVDAWLFDRLVAEDGAIAKCYMKHFAATEEQLIEIWERDWTEHLHSVRQYFGDDPRLIHVDMESESPIDLGRRLASVLALDNINGPDQWSIDADRSLESKLLQFLDRGDDQVADTNDAFSSDVAAFCLSGLNPRAHNSIPRISKIGCKWDGNSGFRGVRNAEMSIALIKSSGHGPDYVISPAGPFNKFHRAEGVINDILRLSRRADVIIDMQDSRFSGSKIGDRLDHAMIAYNRRVNAENMVLWPLPEMHGPETFGFTTATTDTIPFEEKRDEIVWRGMISGYEPLADGSKGIGALASLSQLELAGDDPAARDLAWESLCRTSRMSVIKRWFGQPGYDLGIVMSWSRRKFANDPFLARYCTGRKNLAFFHQFRYQLSMAGHDTGSNFIPMINSQSVMLKEEDGWEVYYSGRFKPWVHYIPLEVKCDDLPEKLEWARRHPDECKEMSRLARAEVSNFANPHLHRQILDHILDGLEAGSYRNDT